MKLIALTSILAAGITQAATLVTSGTTPFTAIGTETDSLSVDPNTGETSFSNTNGQGAGVSLNPDVAGGNPFTTSAPTYFDFSARVSSTTLEVFFGDVDDRPNSANGRASDSTAFSLGISPDAITTFSTGTPSDLLVPTTPYAVGTKLNFSVVVTPTPAQNAGEFFFDYDVVVTVDGTSETASATGIRANQNARSGDGYTFNGIGTQNTVSTLGPVTISDMPILVPEPSHLMLSCVALLALGAHRKRS